MKTVYKKMMAVLLAVILIVSLSAFTASAASVIALSIDGKPLTIPAGYGTPYIDSANRTQVPLRAVSEALGGVVDWDQNTATASVSGVVKVTLGAYTIVTPYGYVTMDTTPVAMDGRLYVPVRFLCQALGYDVDATASNGGVRVNIVTKVELNISAAASLKNVLTELQGAYAAAKPNAKLTLNFAASGTLQTQIEQGAPADVFFSAATSNMDKLKSEGLLVDSTVRNLLGNDVVLIVPKASTLTIGSFADVAGSAVKSVGLGDPASVPAGKYAQDVFTYYKIWDQVKAKAVFGTPVTQILSWVETGNVDCGVVYSTDAASSAKVRIIATAIDASHTPIIYPAAVVRASAHAIAAADFVNFLSSPAAKALFVKYGFKTL